MTETKRILIPEFGLELGVARKPGGAWWLVYSGAMTARERQAAPSRDSAAVLALARPVPYGRATGRQGSPAPRRKSRPAKRRASAAKRRP